MKRREFLTRSLGFATGAVGLVAAGPAGRAMASPAQGHRILDLELFDTARQRPVPVRLYLPQQASAESPVPLVVFSHGLGGSRMGYSYLARHWANAGLASLHPQHVGSDNSVWRGNPLELLQRLQAAARESEALPNGHFEVLDTAHISVVDDPLSVTALVDDFLQRHIEFRRCLP